MWALKKSIQTYHPYHLTIIAAPDPCISSLLPLWLPHPAPRSHVGCSSASLPSSVLSSSSSSARFVADVGAIDDDKVAVVVMILMMMMPEARRQCVTLWRFLVILAHNCCKRQLQAEKRRSD